MSVPSIFNDVLGPIMRGPSSSHSAGALRIGRIALDLMQGKLTNALVEYDPNGSLVTTHKSQGSDMGLFGGFLGWNADDERLVNYQQHLDDAGINVDIRYQSYGASHPNTYKLTLTNDHFEHQLTGISTGGGVIEIVSIDEVEVQLLGDSYVLVLFVEPSDKVTEQALFSMLKRQNKQLRVKFCSGDKPLIIIESSKPINTSVVSAICEDDRISHYRLLNPVMPILNNPEMDLPFNNAFQMLNFIKDKSQSETVYASLSFIAMEYESARSGLCHQQLFEKMNEIRQVMANAVATGLTGTYFTDRLLPAQSPTFKEKHLAGQLLPSSMLNEIVMQVTAIMEAKSSMHTIVAAPTAGSCGAMAGAVLGAAKVLGSSEEEINHALFVAGLIGVLVAKDATFAAEEAGCMAECGSGSGMAAAALVFLHGGSIEQCLTAASMALQNSFGMICDPIANRVEAPCLGKNVMAASNALSCANMALAGFDQVVPIDEVITAMAKVGAAIPHELCCTALGGLSQTPTAQRLERQLAGTHTPVNQIHFKSC